jgi:ATP-dependent Clp protease protease subunit
MSKRRSNKRDLEETQVIQMKVGPAILFGPIDDDIAAEIVTWIIEANLSEIPLEELHLIINSEGGDLSACMSIIEAMNASKIPVRTTGMGQVMSAGLFIFMNGMRGQRRLTESCTVLSHNFNTGAEGSYAEHKMLSHEYDRLDKLIVGHYVKCTGLTEPEVRQSLVTDHDVFMGAEEAFRLKLCDSVGVLIL